MPDNRPVVVLNVAQDGRLLMLKVSESPSGSLAVGVNEYDCPATIEVAGDPEMTGGRLATSTSIWNVGNDLVNIPSLTLIWMLSYTPACATEGVPESRPVVAFRLAQGGLLLMLKVSAFPSGSEAVGVKL